MAEETEEKPTRPPLYADREEWKDIKPLEQSDLTQPLVPIFYPQECKAVIKSYIPFIDI